ncbi:unnamed protein product [Prorocentrum cordatum]|uniref:Uncharacterized protein n=1 Tax=Prorocentrum cordatum TaxID=2364126 RepID=A0ABN9P9R4_9DINO|nr:unnamed protein product [Polarella glacialis]
MSELDPAEQERMLDILVATNVHFVQAPDGNSFSAKIRTVRDHNAKRRVSPGSPRFSTSPSARGPGSPRALVWPTSAPRSPRDSGSQLALADAAVRSPRVQQLAIAGRGPALSDPAAADGAAGWRPAAAARQAGEPYLSIADIRSAQARLDLGRAASPALQHQSTRELGGRARTPVRG